MSNPNILPNVISDDPKLFSDEQIEEERLRSDILKYLVNKRWHSPSLHYLESMDARSAFQNAKKRKEVMMENKVEQI